MMHLGIASDGLMSMPPKRPNLCYRATHVHSQQQRREALVKLLCGEGAGVGGASVRRSRSGGGGRGEGRRGGRGSQSWRRGKGFEDSSASSSTTGDKIDKALVDPTIVYVFRRDEAESLAEFLEAAGLPAVPYHAGMDADARAKVRGEVNVQTLRS
jgi:superfamily II DNA helicase RecQ